MQIKNERIELILAEKGLTKAALAEKGGFRRQNLSTILKRGTCEPKTAGKIAKALGVTPAEIIRTED